MPELSLNDELQLIKIAKKLSTQGNHHAGIKKYYEIMTKAAREQFNEDNKPTLDAFLTEMHQESLDK